jgi:hypothetical protein
MNSVYHEFALLLLLSAVVACHESDVEALSALDIAGRIACAEVKQTILAKESS